MKKFLAALLLAAILVTSVAFAANVQFTGSTHVYKYAGSHKLATVIRKGSIAKKVGSCGKTWTQIQLTDKKGTKVWVKSKYVKSTKKDGNIIYSAGGAGYSTAGKKGPGMVAGWYIVNTFKKGQKTNIRAKANLSSKSLCTVKYGTKVYVLGPTQYDSRGVEWVKVKYKGKTGWLSRTNVEKDY